jgi:hypothetical protein
MKRSSALIWVTTILLLSPLHSLWAGSAHQSQNRERAQISAHPTLVPERPDFRNVGEALQLVLDATDQKLEKVSMKARRVFRSQWTKNEKPENHLEKYLSDYLKELRSCARARPKKSKPILVAYAEQNSKPAEWPLLREDSSSRLTLPEIVAGLGANQSTKREAASRFLSQHLDVYSDELQTLATSATDKEVQLRSSALVAQLPARSCVLLAQQKYAEKIFQEVYPDVPFAACGKEKQ